MSKNAIAHLLNISRSQVQRDIRKFVKMVRKELSLKGIRKGDL